MNKKVVIKQHFIEALDQPEIETKYLEHILSTMLKDHRDVFDEYIANDLYEPINPDPLNWDGKYYIEQKNEAKRNFSQERLDHLIKVREYGRQKELKGFLPHSKIVPVMQSQSVYSEDSKYTPSDILDRSIRENNMLGIRTALRMELLDMNLDTATLRAALNWVKKQSPDLCEPYVEKNFCGPMDRNIEYWDKDYFFKQEVYLDTSFTEERFLHMIEVREHLRQKKVEGFIPDKARQKPQETSRKTQTTPNQSASGNYKERKFTPQEDKNFIKLALVIGGAIAALVTLIFIL